MLRTCCNYCTFPLSGINVSGYLILGVTLINRLCSKMPKIFFLSNEAFGLFSKLRSLKDNPYNIISFANSKSLSIETSTSCSWVINDQRIALKTSTFSLSLTALWVRRWLIYPLSCFYKQSMTNWAFSNFYSFPN